MKSGNLFVNCSAKGRLSSSEGGRLEVRIDVWPEASWTLPYDDGTLEVTVPKAKRDNSVREKAMEALRERYCEVVETEEGYAAQFGDQLVVDMEGYERDDDDDDDDGSEGGGALKKKGPLPVSGPVGGRDLDLVLESGKFLPGLAEALVGAVAGDTKVVEIDFPEAKAYRDSQPLAGVKAAFEVKVSAVKRRVLPPLDDAFASKIRSGLTLAELEAEVENTVGSKEDDQTEDQLHAELEKALADRCTCPLPASVVTESAKQKFAVMLADMRSNGTPDSQLKQLVSPESFEKYQKVVKPTVERELRARLAIESIAKLEALAVEDGLVDEQMELVRRQYEQQQPPEGGATFDADKAREKVSSELLRIKVLDYAKSIAKITYVDAPEVAQTLQEA